MKNLIREMEKQFDERFEENKRFFEDTRNEGLANMKNFAKSFFQDYTEKIVEGIREKMEKGKLGLNPSSFEEDMEKTADMESYNQGIDSCLALLSSLTDKEK